MMFRKNKTLKIFALFLFLTGLGGGLYFVGQEESAVLNFRTTKSPLKPSVYSPDLTGLRELNASVSGRLSASKIKKNFANLPEKLTVIDARAEQDIYLNGISAGWLGVKFEDGKLIDRVFTPPFNKKTFYRIKCCWRRLLNFGTIYLPDLSHFQTEEDFLKSLGYGYYAFEGARHKVHDDETIDRFVKFLDHLPKDTWLHFHCAAGRGRSTTFVIMYDIYRNGKRVALEDIILRQHLIGGENVLDVAMRPKGTWSKEDLLDRKELVENFYAYITDPRGHGYQKWSQWLVEQNKKGMRHADQIASQPITKQKESM